MKKIIALFLSFLISGALVANAAATKAVNPVVYSGIAKYKKANYTGCLQDMETALKKNPNDILAKYYMALVYTKIGMQEEAKQYYQKVVAQGDEKVLVTYSKKALVCLDNPMDELCGNRANQEDLKDLDEMSVFIQSGQFLHPDLQKKIRDRELKNIQDSFNSNITPDMNDYRFINDASEQIPTDAEIAAAVKVLAKVGYNPLNSYNPYMAQNPQMEMLSMLGQNNQNKNSMTDMLPYLMAQKGNNTISPDLIQAMLLNQSIGSIDFGGNN